MVAMSVWPTDGADGSVASEARWRKMGRLWAPSGIAGNMTPTLAYPNLTIQPGAAWVDGHYAELASSQVLTATTNGLAVVRFDPAANTAELLWRDGVSVPAQSPTGVWELPIAKTVGGVLTDLRVSTTAMITPAPHWTTGGPTVVATGSNQLYDNIGPFKIDMPAIVEVALDIRATPETAQAGGQIVQFYPEKATLGPALDFGSSAFLAKQGTPAASNLPVEGSLRGRFRMTTAGSFYYGLRATVGSGGYSMTILWAGAITVTPY
jgi:hypothetical protein